MPTNLGESAKAVKDIEDNVSREMLNVMVIFLIRRLIFFIC